MSEEMGGASMKNGTRFELVLESSEANVRALYLAEVHREGKMFTATVEITTTGARIVAGGEGLEAVYANQLVALAKTLGKRADEAPWPRRINRWRQPGVR